MFRSCMLLLAILAARTMALAQTAGTPAPTRPAYDALPRPPVPADPLELVTEAAQPVQTAERRLAVARLLANAHYLSNVRSQPYHLKTLFTASGGLASDGTWILEDISPGRGIYRWSAQGPNYTAVNLYTDRVRGLVYSSMPSGAIPLRLLQARQAIFHSRSAVSQYTSIRTATAYLNGVEQTCILTGTPGGGRVFAGARDWDEVERCVDASTGLLTTYSPVPGLYIHYDYAKSVTFHGKTIPAGFQIAAAGKTVLEAQTQSVTEPPDPQNALFNPAGLTSLGVGRLMNPSHGSIRTPLLSPSSRGAPRAQASIQMVVLHGSLSDDGGLAETEILVSTDSSVNQIAINRAMELSKGSAFFKTQPGVTPQSHELLVTIEVVKSAP